jgi:hypothetical protein
VIVIVFLVSDENLTESKLNGRASLEILVRKAGLIQ